MGSNASTLKSLSNRSYQSAVNTVESEIKESKGNYEKLVTLHNERGYDTETGVYSEFTAASTKLSESFDNLINNNDWVEIPWMNDTMGSGGKNTKVDGKNYYKVKYNRELPKIGKRNHLVFRVGGTFTYPKNYYVTNAWLVNGKKRQRIDLSKEKLLSCAGDGTKTFEAVTFNDEPALKIGCKFNAANQSWEEVQTNITVEEYDIQKYNTLEYDIYFEPVTNKFEYTYGGAICSCFDFKNSVVTLTDNV